MLSQASWSMLVAERRYRHLFMFARFSGSAPVNNNELFSTMIQHLEELAVSFGQYFFENPNPEKGKFWIVGAGFYQA